MSNSPRGRVGLSHNKTMKKKKKILDAMDHIKLSTFLSALVAYKIILNFNY